MSSGHGHLHPGHSTLFLKGDRTAQHHSLAVEDVAGCCPDGGRAQFLIYLSRLQPMCFMTLFRTAGGEPVSSPFPLFLSEPQCRLQASGFARCCTELRLPTRCKRQSRQRSSVEQPEMSCSWDHPWCPAGLGHHPCPLNLQQRRCSKETLLLAPLTSDPELGRSWRALLSVGQ